MGIIAEIIWPHFRRSQVYDTDTPSVRVDFSPDGIHVIKPMPIEFPARYKYSRGTAERRMLPLILRLASTVHKMQGCTANYPVIYLDYWLFAGGQTYTALNR